MTSLTNCLQPAAIETAGANSQSTTQYLSSLTKKLVDMSGDTRERQWLHQHISAYPWLWSEGTLPTYWDVCKFDLILIVPSVLTSITAHHLFQCIAIASRKCVLSVSFLVSLCNVSLLIG